MGTIKETAQNYEPPTLKNIADLSKVSVELNVLEEKDAEYPYMYVLVDGERYVVKKTVLTSLKMILEENPNLKEFKVKREGEGLKTKYTVIPLS